MTIRKLQRPVPKKNSWECVAASAATILGIKLSDFFLIAGHDGSEKIVEEAPDPNGRRGFHMQEVQRVAYTMGVVFAEFQPLPRLAVAGQVVVVQQPTDSISRSLHYGQGLIVLAQKDRHHCVAFSRGNVFDPDTTQWVSLATFIARIQDTWGIESVWLRTTTN